MKRHALDGQCIGRNMAGGSDTDIEAVLDAVLIAEPKPIILDFEPEGEGRRQLNYSAVSTVAVAIVFLLLAMYF